MEEKVLRLKLKSGVYLTVIPAKQFKTVRVAINLIAQLKPETQSKRLLLANILENSAADFPNQAEIARQLAAMYGTGFGVTVNRRGNSHNLSFILNCLNDSFSEQSLLDKGMNFLKQIIFHPLAAKNEFENENFIREQQNLRQTIVSAADNKQLTAYLALQKVYFTNPIQQEPSFGTLKQLAAITASELWQYYQRSLREDQVEIIFLGDITTQRAQQLAEKLNFSARVELPISPFYQQNWQPKIRTNNFKQTVTQSKLDLAFFLPVYYNQPEFMSALVFNAILGGLPLSRLFVNVREKQGLAYYASSSFDSFRGVLTVQTGIDAVNREKAQALIMQQLTELQQAKISRQELIDAKKMLINDYQSQLDSQSSQLSHALLTNLTGRELNSADWEESISSVNVEQVARIAQQAKLQASAYLQGMADK